MPRGRAAIWHRVKLTENERDELTQLIRLNTVNRPPKSTGLITQGETTVISRIALVEIFNFEPHAPVKREWDRCGAAKLGLQPPFMAGTRGTGGG